MNGEKVVIIAILESPGLREKRMKKGDIEYMDREKITQIIILNIIEIEVEVLKEMEGGTVAEDKDPIEQEIEIGSTIVIEEVITEGILLIGVDEVVAVKFRR